MEPSEQIISNAFGIRFYGSHGTQNNKGAGENNYS